MRAIFSLMKEEHTFLPLWLKHYSKYFDNIELLHHYRGEKPDLSELHKQYKFKEIPMMADYHHNTEWMLARVKEHQVKMFGKYKVVMFAEADEFVITDPTLCKDLGVFLDEFEESDMRQVTCNGREVLQYRDKPINLEEPILSQRTYWWQFNSYGKTLISKDPLNWVHGFHYTEDMLQQFNEHSDHLKELFKNQNDGREMQLGDYIIHLAEPSLYMAHMQKMDWDVFNTRGRYCFNKGRFTVGEEQKTKIPERFKHEV